MLTIELSVSFYVIKVIHGGKYVELLLRLTMATQTSKLCNAS